MKPIRVFVFDDNEERRESLRFLVKSYDDLEWVGSAADCSQAVREVELAQPDVILMDIQMPNVDGIDGLRLIKKKYPSVSVLMQTVFEDDDKIFESLKAGASGYILKKTTPERVAEAIRDVAYGGAPITPSIAARVLAHYGNSPDSPDEVESYNLTKREKEILALLVDGLSYKMISDKLNIAYFTVNNHIRKIYEKLAVHSQTEAVSKALREKLLTLLAIVAFTFLWN
jgi:DNA-binding NarL/FixJ family response regulator